MFHYSSSSAMRPRSSISSRSSSTFSSRNFTQSDTEAEEEKKYQKRIVQRRNVLTPSKIKWDWDSRKEMLASCSTPKSSQEDLLGRFHLLEDTSVYFRPHPIYHQQRHVKRQKRAKCQQSQQLSIDDYFHGIRRRNPYTRRREYFKIAESGKTPTKQKVQKHAVERHNNPMEGVFWGMGQCESEMAVEEGPRKDEEQCSSPILLDFGRILAGRRETENVPAVGGHRRQISSQLSPHTNGPSTSFSPLGRNCTVLGRIRMKHKMKRDTLLKRAAENLDDTQQRYTNLPVKQMGEQDDGDDRRTKGANSDNGRGGKMVNCNSDSGMEEKLEEDDDRTQFVNLSAVEKVYENLPPVASVPLPPAPKPPRGPSLAIVLPQQFAEDFPALYARLVALAFLNAQSECRKNRRENSATAFRHIQLAQKQVCELVGLRLSKSTELNASTDSDECFRRKCAEFCSQLAQKLRTTEAHSRKEFGWQTKKLQKILHHLRAADGRSGGERTLEGALHKLFRRIFRK